VCVAGGHKEMSLSWLTNSALVYEVNGGGGGGAKINFGTSSIFNSFTAFYHFSKLCLQL
jgi:hypothetical protein